MMPTQGWRDHRLPHGQRATARVPRFKCGQSFGIRWLVNREHALPGECARILLLNGWYGKLPVGYTRASLFDTAYGIEYNTATSKS